MTVKSGFEPIGNMGCRLWWGRPRALNDRDMGAWNGRWLMGVNGPRPGRFELAFENWCRENGLACLRTVNLFWAFQYHRSGFPSRVDDAVIRKNWREQRKQRREAPKNIQLGRILHLGSDLKELSRKEIRRYIDHWYPDPGPWKQYRAERKAYFVEESERYRQVIAFWKQRANLRRMFLRCAEFSNRRPESHPDYLLVFGNGTKNECAFVEVKSPRESLRPSQRRFFPELVKEAFLRVMVVRLTEDGRNVRFFEFSSGGNLLVCPPPGPLR